MTFDPGNIVLIQFPFSDLKTGKRRPVLMLTNPDNNGDFIALAVTSKSYHPVDRIGPGKHADRDITPTELDKNRQGFHTYPESNCKGRGQSGGGHYRTSHNRNL